MSGLSRTVTAGERERKEGGIEATDLSQGQAAVSLTTTNFKPLIFSASLRLVIYHEHLHSHGFA
jgi:hypothetical protein